MPMLLRGRAGPQAAQYHDRHRTKRNSSRTDQDSPPPQFWDNLSHIPLVKRALRELDRRNNTTLPRGQGPEASRPSPGDIRQLEAGIIYQDIKRFSRTGGPDLTDLRGYAHSPTESQDLSERQGRRRRRPNMPRRGSTRGGRTSGSVLGKRGRHTGGGGDGSVDSEYEPGPSARRGRRPRPTGRAEGAGIRHKSVSAIRDKSTTTATSTRSGPYDPAFRQHLLDYNVLPVEYESLDGREPEPPDNLSEIEAELGAVRPLEPDEDFRRLRSQYRRVSNEDDALKLLDSLEGDREALLQSHVMRQKKMLSNLAPLTDGSIPPGNPDRAYGAPASELDRSVRLELDELVVPTREKDFICPNFIVHVKSNKGDATVAMAPAAYDGALAARGMQALWDFGGGPDMASRIQTPRGDTGGSTAALGVRPDGVTDSSPGHEDRARVARVARTITCTWTTGVLKMYATYCEVNPNPGEGALSTNLESGFPKYVPSSIGSWIMTDKENQFLHGLAAYRNGLDWAKRQRDMVISRANARVRAEQARRRREEEEEGPGEDLGANEAVQPGGEDSYEQDNNYEDDGGLSSIFARPGSGAGRQDEEAQDSDAADENPSRSFDSQRTVTTRSMRRKQEEGRRS